jgi:hypothetical protein
MNMEELKVRIQEGYVLGEETFRNIELDRALEGRDDEWFDTTWMVSFNRLKSQVLSLSQKAAIDEVRELAFKKTYEFCSDADLAAYVSDDFELICKVLLLGLDDHFIFALWQCYKSGVIPGFRLEPIGGGIA